MDEKDLAQAQSLADEKLDDVNGGSRILSACDELNAPAETGRPDTDEGDDTRGFAPCFPF